VKGLRYNPLVMLETIHENRMLGARRAQGSNSQTQNDSNDNAKPSFSARD